MKHYLLWIIITFGTAIGMAAPNVYFAGIDVRPSYAFSSFRDDVLRNNLILDNARRTRIAGSLHLKGGFTYSPESPQWRFFPGVWQGVGISVNTFGNSRGLGNPVNLYLFQGAPVWHITSGLSLYYEWNFGASFGWKPCDGVTARSNLIVGSKTNAYINLGSGLRWSLGKGRNMTAGIDLTHFSNGNTSYPNPGVNMAGIRIGLTHTFGNRNDYNNHSNTISDEDSAPTDEAAELSIRKKRPELDLTVYGAWRKRVYRGGETPVLLKGHYGIAGINISPMWKIARIFRTGVSADFQWDESTNLSKYRAAGSTTDDILFYRPPFFSQVSGGLSGRAELVMPVFSVNVGIGYNFFGPEESRGTTYQLANLRIRFAKDFYLNIGYQLLNFQRQNNLMLGLGYTFR